MICTLVRVIDTIPGLKDYLAKYTIWAVPSKLLINPSRIKGKTGPILFRLEKSKQDMTGIAHFYGTRAHAVLLNVDQKPVTMENINITRSYQAILCTIDGKCLPSISPTQFSESDDIVNVRVNLLTFRSLVPYEKTLLIPDLEMYAPNDTIYTSSDATGLIPAGSVWLRVTRLYKDKGHRYVKGFLIKNQKIVTPIHPLVGQAVPMSFNDTLSYISENGKFIQNRYQISGNDRVIPGHTFSLGNLRIYVIKLETMFTFIGYKLKPKTHRGKLFKS